MRPGCASNESVLSDIVAVHVDYKLLLAVERGREADETSHSLALVVKLLPSDPFSRVFVTEAQFDLREISFYTKVAHPAYPDPDGKPKPRIRAADPPQKRAKRSFGRNFEVHIETYFKTRFVVF